MGIGNHPGDRASAPPSRTARPPVAGRAVQGKGRAVRPTRVSGVAADREPLRRQGRAGSGVAGPRLSGQGGHGPAPTAGQEMPGGAVLSRMTSWQGSACTPGVALPSMAANRCWAAVLPSTSRFMSTVVSAGLVSVESTSQLS